MVAWPVVLRTRSGKYPWAVANEVIRMSLKDFERGLVSPPTPDDVSITVDGRRLDSKDAVLAWWADVAAEIEDEEAVRHGAPGA